MLNSGPSSENKRYPFILNPFHLYLDMCSTFNHNISKNTIRDIRKVMRRIKSHSKGGGELSRNNHKVNYGGLLGYLETWFHPNGLGNILSLDEVYKFFVITYNRK